MQYSVTLNAYVMGLTTELPELTLLLPRHNPSMTPAAGLEMLLPWHDLKRTRNRIAAGRLLRMLALRLYARCPIHVVSAQAHQRFEVHTGG